MNIQPVHGSHVTQVRPVVQNQATSELNEPKFGPKAEALKRSPEEIIEQASKAQQQTPANQKGVNIVA